MRLSRRAMLTVGSAAVASVGALRPSLGQQTKSRAISNISPDQFREIASAFDSAEKLGIYNPGRASAARKGDDPSFILSETLDRALDRAASGDESAANIADRFGLILSELNRSKRDAVALDILGDGRARHWSFTDLKDEYQALFQSISIGATHRSELNTAARRILNSDSRKRYQEVQEITGVPWFVVGALHYREASLNFLGHLHNGDFLKIKTVQVPSNRPSGSWPPVPWNAGEAWKLSAVDALRDYRKLESWTVPQMLFMFESYNGWGYRNHPGFRSPYLWNYTQHYSRGGFPRDHQWSATYVSRQAGLASIIRALSELAPQEVILAMG